MAADGFKLFVPHAEGCVYAERGEDSFILHEGYDFNRDRIGRKGGSTTWLRFRCNSPNCSAVAGVRWDMLEAFISEGLN